MAEPARNRIDGLWGVRYGEILLARFDGTSFSAEVWNTMGFNDCPPTEFAELDARAIAAERCALVALKNGPRHWVLDAIEAQMRETAPTTKFGTLEMFLAATVDFGSTPPSPIAYTERSVARDTVFEWAAGTPLYQLTSPDGKVYVMQAIALYVDPSQTLDSLKSLADRLELPDGWTFATHVADRPLRLLSTEGVATVLQDELANTYHRVDRTD
ncbi:MAG: hypothetical protein ABSD78_18750 [Acidimicrobiales bacterium]|jgi:hypothetical protein